MIALLLALGCPSTGTCTETVEVVGLEAVTPLSVSAADVLALVEGPRRAPLEYEAFLGLQPTWLDLELTWDGGEVRYVRGVSEGDAACPSRLEVDTTWSLATEDGALAEALPVILISASKVEAHLEQEVALGGLTGPWIDDGEPVVSTVFHGVWEQGEAGVGWVDHAAEYTILGEDGEDWVETEVYTVATWVEGAD